MKNLLILLTFISASLVLEKVHSQEVHSFNDQMIQRVIARVKLETKHEIAANMVKPVASKQASVEQAKPNVKAPAISPSRQPATVAVVSSRSASLPTAVNSVVSRVGAVPAASSQNKK